MSRPRGKSTLHHLSGIGEETGKPVGIRTKRQRSRTVVIGGRRPPPLVTAAAVGLEVVRNYIVQDTHTVAKWYIIYRGRICRLSNASPARVFPRARARGQWYIKSRESISTVITLYYILSILHRDIATCVFLGWKFDRRGSRPLQIFFIHFSRDLRRPVAVTVVTPPSVARTPPRRSACQLLINIGAFHQSRVNFHTHVVPAFFSSADRLQTARVTTMQGIWEKY